MRLYGVLFSFILFLGMGNTGARAEDVQYSLGSVEKSSKEFLIPRELRARIEKSYLEYIRKNRPKVVLADEEILSRIPREFLDVEISLRGSAPGVLSDHTVFKLPRGGGEIDLKDYVKGSKGSFFMTFLAKRSNDPKHEVKDLHVYFLSEARERKIAGEKFGSGCRRYMDITDFIASTQSSGGLQLNATAQRYLSVVGGVFYFVEFNPERRIYLSAVRMKDSRYPDLACAPENHASTL